MVKATFSNGQSAVYEGKRNVKASWAVIEKETSSIVLSGFSASYQAAAKSKGANVKEALHLMDGVDRQQEKDVLHRARVTFEVVAL